MMKRRNITGNKRGDTIIEVLISLTILSLAMSISYATVNSSIQALYAARTTANATALLQQQVEATRITSNIDSNISTAGFCFTGSPLRVQTFNAATCKINNYNLKILEDSAGSGKYTATATWNVGSKTYTSRMNYVK